MRGTPAGGRVGKAPEGLRESEGLPASAVIGDQGGVPKQKVGEDITGVFECH